MSSLWKKILLVLIFLTLPIPLLAAGVLPSGRPEFEFIYDRLERNDALSQDNQDYQLGPYSLELARSALGPFDWLDRLDQNSLRLFGSFGEHFRSVKSASATGYESLEGGIVARPIDKLFVYGRISLDEALASDPNYTGKKWRGLAGGVDDAFVQYQTGTFSLLAGRFASFWGPRGSMALAPGVSMDGFGYSYRWGRLTLSYRLARLDGLSPERDSVAQFENRYFAAHRLDVHLSTRIRVGFFETAIFGGPGRQLDLYFLNPILFYHASQLNDGPDDNTYLGFDFAVKPMVGVKLYGQMMVDDYQLDNRTQSDQEPNEYGLLFGGYWADVLPQFDVKAEYSKVTNRTFNQYHPRNRYLYKGELIGGALGNDYDLWGLTALYWVRPELQVSANLSQYRQGEGQVDQTWDQPWLDVTGDYSEPFPTGTVQRATTVSLGIKGFVAGCFYVDAATGIDRVINYGHIAGDRRTLPFLNCRLSAFLSSPLRVN